jgi:hypothetical protein
VADYQWNCPQFIDQVLSHFAEGERVVAAAWAELGLRGRLYPTDFDLLIDPPGIMVGDGVELKALLTGPQRYREALPHLDWEALTSHIAFDRIFPRYNPALTIVVVARSHRIRMASHDGVLVARWQRLRYDAGNNGMLSIEEVSRLIAGDLSDKVEQHIDFFQERIAPAVRRALPVGLPIPFALCATAF